MQTETLIASGGPTVTQYDQPGHPHMRGDGGDIIPRKSIQLRADPPRRWSAVAPSRSGEMTVHPFVQTLRDISAVLAAFLLVSMTGLGIAFALFVLLFCSL